MVDSTFNMLAEVLWVQNKSSSTQLYSWCEVFVLICCIWILLHVALCITSTVQFGLVCLKDTVPAILCFVAVSLSISSLT